MDQRQRQSKSGFKSVDVSIEIHRYTGQFLSKLFTYIQNPLKTNLSSVYSNSRQDGHFDEENLLCMVMALVF